MENTDFKIKILDYCSGDWIPESKRKEDEFLEQCSALIKHNCKKNPGKLGEWVVCQVFGNCEINQRIECNWLLGQTEIRPDITLNDTLVCEIKTLRYYNCKGKRGNQGTGSEKIDSIFRKYDGVNKKKLIVLVADQQFEKNGLMFLKAFNEDDYSNNGQMEYVMPYYKANQFEMISFKQLRINHNL